MTQAHSAPHAPQRYERLPEAPEVHEDHGHSTAAWVGVALMILGSVLVALGIVLPSQVILWVGVVVTVLGAIAWPLGVKMGYGSKHAA